MKAIDPEEFHFLFGAKRPRINYRRKDFVDYSLMIAATAVVIVLSYRSSVLSAAGVVLCAVMLGMFAFRHGVAWSAGALLRSPQEAIFMVGHKLLNIEPAYVLGLAVLLAENYLILWTPTLPHHTEWLRNAALAVFYLHLLLLTGYRTVSLVDHLRKTGLVRDVLLESSWRSAILKQPNVVLEIVHAYCTGLLTHLVLVAPWYIVLTHMRFSIIFMPLVCVIDVVVYLRFVRAINGWFYRDHWLGHNSEIDFLYLHGPHHDAIPSGLIGCGGNGFLEGFLRNTMGYPTPFYNPLFAAVCYTFEVQQDIISHQYIPGIFPKLSRELQIMGQHSIHHFGRLEPYGFGIKLDQDCLSEEFKNFFQRFPEEFRNSIELDEKLTGFKWNNSRYRWFLDMCRKYED